MSFMDAYAAHCGTSDATAACRHASTSFEALASDHRGDPFHQQDRRTSWYSYGFSLMASSEEDVLEIIV